MCATYYNILLNTQQINLAVILVEGSSHRHWIRIYIIRVIISFIFNSHMSSSKRYIFSF
jgi:hypothetical protein